MNKKWGWLVLAAALVVLISGASVLYNKYSAEVENERLMTEDSTQEFVGKPTIVNFWASWCGPCKMEMPDFDEKYKELGEEINFVMVNMTDGAQETAEKAKAFVEESGYSFPVYYDTDMDAAMTYGVSSIPSTFFIDAEGHAVAWAQGMIDAATLQKGIDMLKGDVEE